MTPEPNENRKVKHSENLGWLRPSICMTSKPPIIVKLPFTNDFYFIFLSFFKSEASTGTLSFPFTPQVSRLPPSLPARSSFALFDGPIFVLSMHFTPPPFGKPSFILCPPCELRPPSRQFPTFASPTHSRYGQHNDIQNPKQSSPPRRRPRPSASANDRNNFVRTSRVNIVTSMVSSKPHRKNSDDSYSNNNDNSSFPKDGNSTANTHSPESSPEPLEPLIGDDSYLQCPQCMAVYQVDADELDSSPRVVSCSSCLHEWYAAEDSLLWGDDIALKTLVASRIQQTPSYVKAQPSFPRDADTDRMDDKQSGGNEEYAEMDEKKKERKSERREMDITFSETGKMKRYTGRRYSSQNRRERLTIDHDYDKKNEIVPEEEDEDVREEGFEGAQLEERNDDVNNNSQSTAKDNVRTNNKSSPPNNGSSTSTTQAINKKHSNSVDRNISTPTPTASSSPSTRKGSEDSVNESGLVMFVGNLSFRATEEDLYRAFSGYGTVERCQVPSDFDGASKGFGFVKMSAKEGCVKAMKALQGASILGRDIALSYARNNMNTSYEQKFDSGGNSERTQSKRRGDYRGRNTDGGRVWPRKYTGSRKNTGTEEGRGNNPRG